MYIIWIGWLYVVLMFALGQRTLPMTVFVLILFGALPTWLLLFVASSAGDEGQWRHCPAQAAPYARRPVRGLSACPHWLLSNFAIPC